jgi:hypothetical protein
MQRTKPENLDKPKRADIQRDSMEDIRELQSSPGAGDIRYRDPNRDRALGEADRTGRHFDEDIEEGAAEASEEAQDHEAD